MEKYILMAGILCLLCAGLGFIVLRWYLVRYTTSLTRSLDEMIEGKREIIFDEENEWLMSKVQVRLRQLYEILQSRTEQSRRERAELEGIISDISHQVKTPLANIRMYHAILLKRSLPPEKQAQFLHLVDGQVEKLDSLMQSMVEMSQMEIGMICTKPVRQPLPPLIEQAVCQIALKAERKRIDIQVECEDWMQAVFDLKWTLEALGNILDNAVKYTGEGGKIKISALVTDFFVRIKVSDNGKGIPESQYTKVFKRFYRAADVQQEEGVGVGLFLAQEIIRMQKGYIDLKSQVGAGSEFSINLPAEI